MNKVVYCFCILQILNILNNNSFNYFPIVNIAHSMNYHLEFQSTNKIYFPKIKIIFFTTYPIRKKLLIFNISMFLSHLGFL